MCYWCFAHTNGCETWKDANRRTLEEQKGGKGAGQITESWQEKVRYHGSPNPEPRLTITKTLRDFKRARVGAQKATEIHPEVSNISLQFQNNFVCKC